MDSLALLHELRPAAMQPNDGTTCWLVCRTYDMQGHGASLLALYDLRVGGERPITSDLILP